MTTPSKSGRRLLLMHAHPDDETIGNGVTMAKYVAEGASVTLVTCTLGEEGEVLVGDLAHLAAHRDDALGQHRINELDLAMKHLGVTDHRFLGGAGRYRDTGMATDERGAAIPPPTVRDDSFWRADLTEASNQLVAVMREVRPQVLVTYDEVGGYGHPDHIQAHRVAMYASLLAAVPSYRRDLGEPWEIGKIYWNAMSEGRLRDGLRRLRDMGDMTTFEGMDPDGPLPPFVVSDDVITTEIEGSEFLAAKMAAMAAHATQIALDGPFFALSNNLGNSVWGVEAYRLIHGTAVPSSPGGKEVDLFAGLT
ncbi:MAG: N-acetyl-1-D-myo-inositol-2-amino-2-deoxy-alpha-D-glucopyranoside deacetylase [Propionibacteriales bacterium]|nr:N-acetyl-1-D-myo-inositol-2-amino-2-deoxy-alpha-D-glucopyranoside deacetylase [Propionibacteriales bacterium]